MIAGGRWRCGRCNGMHNRFIELAEHLCPAEPLRELIAPKLQASLEDDLAQQAKFAERWSRARVDLADKGHQAFARVVRALQGIAGRALEPNELDDLLVVVALLFAPKGQLGPDVYAALGSYRAND